MQKRRAAKGRNRTGSGTSIWLALAVALGLHSIFLFLPISRQIPATENIPAQIELQLTTFSPQQPLPEVSELQPEAEVEPPETIIEPDINIAEVKPEVIQPVAPPVTRMAVQVNDFETLSEPERTRLTNSILSAQFFTPESEADKLFGKPLELPVPGQQRDFHDPIRQDMITMLDQPMPDLPFAYNPGLVSFAYDPGVRGDLQRFWDVITPEFGWKTDNGTEVRCIWVLVIAACGWK